MTDELRVLDSDSPQPTALGARAARSLAIARWCAGRGWPVHPLAPGRKTPAGNCVGCREPGHTYRGCRCPAAGRWCHGFRAATLDRARIERWWGAHPEFGVGIACGPAGLVVIDIDAHARQLPGRDRLLPGIDIADTIDLSGLANGFHTLGVLAALRGVTSPAGDESTLRVRTPSGGLHVWYRAAGGHRWQCSSGSGGGRALAWQVDVRAHGGYIIAPGTVTEAGAYEVVGTAREPAPLPGWLARELERTGHLPPAYLPALRPVPPRARQAVLAAGGGRGAAARVLAPLLAQVAGCAAVPEGAGFTEKLNRAAYTASGLVAAGLLDDGRAERLLREAAAQARPGQERRYGAVIRGGLSAGRARPLSPGGRL
ncbi:bifunctional DNA primase/polymerase [Streptomyces sp. MUSC 14]|uniref:bifunctional DNA primase/polymerase n=1 Tax=Streptomyces sp. MUSC 14 TaxID=1354889 RepID=UPI0009A0BAE3|nr:bifunctional DNA primase/polymerase [Streptomyces sp. MUSC 14]